MQAKRFTAADMRRALDMVKEEFGEDAIILSTERTSKGVEVTASVEETIVNTAAESSLSFNQPSMQEQKVATAASRFKSIPTAASPLAADEKGYQPFSNRDIGLASGKTREQLAEEMDFANRRMRAAQEAGSLTLESWADQQTPQRNIQNKKDDNSATKQESRNRDLEISRLHNEIADMRNTIELQLSHMAETQERQFIEATSSFSKEDASPIVASIKQQLEYLGLTKSCNQQLIKSIKKNKMPDTNKQLLWTHVLAELAKNIPNNISDPVAKGGMYAFLGTTGVGKTTTIAKLAARYVMQHGAEGVVLLTTDNYRIASHNQLTSLAKILNVTVQVVEDFQQLPSYIKQLRHSKLVLIDTPGMGYADPLLKSHLHVLRECKGVENVLVLSANSQYQMMKASLHSYRMVGLRYCVMTKLDECASLGDAISVMSDHEVPLAYITDGQSVPEDIAVLKPSQLVSRAVDMLRSQRKSDLLAQQSM